MPFRSWVAIVILLSVMFGFLPLCPSSFAGEVLDDVRTRKVVRCGVNEELAGFALKDKRGRWRGGEPDFCRAVAAAALGDAGRVEFLPLKTASRFPILLSGRIDLLLHSATMTFGREAGIGVRFPGIYFFDGQAFMVLRSSKKRTIRDLDGSTICVVKGSTHQVNLGSVFQQHKLKYSSLVVDSLSEATDALRKGKCQAVTSDRSHLVAVLATSPDGPQRLHLMPGTFSIEPIGPVVNRGDEEWFTLVRWVIYALIEAEELGVTHQNVRSLLKNPGSPEMHDFLITSGRVGRSLGLRPDWVASVIAAVGNSGEIYERNLGQESGLKIDRGLNRLWNHGGLLYAPPFQ
jgi:general L-amino acid transport system substrate-binding protein